MSSPRTLLSRVRLLILALALGAIVACLALPLPRQLLFGPKIHGEPWCLWEAEVRRLANPEAEQKRWTNQVLDWLGLADVHLIPEHLDHDPELLPLLLQLSRDPDVAVRRQIIHWMVTDPKAFADPSAHDVLLERLAEKDIALRIDAAHGFWLIFEDPCVFPVLMKDVTNTHYDLTHRLTAVGALRASCVKLGAGFEQFAELAKSPDVPLRNRFMMEAFHFGKPAVPYLIKGLRDPDVYVQGSAVQSLKQLGRDAKDAIDPLLELRNHPQENMRRSVQEALAAIDPERFVLLPP
jgi:hypothetical protein